MECRVETGDLGQLRAVGQQRAYRREIVRLMQGGEGDIALEARQHLVIDEHGLGIIRPAVNDPMADRKERDLQFLAQPGASLLGGGGQVRDALGRVGLIDQGGRAVLGAQARARPDAVDLALDEPLQVAGRSGGKDLELEAGGAGIDDEDGVHGDHTAGTAARRRRASA
jgi:hypothetical protein